MADLDNTVRETLADFLTGSFAHAGIHEAVKDMSPALITKKPAGIPYNAWQLLEHIRLTLADLVNFCTKPGYRAPKWPEEYWPAVDTPVSPDAWKTSVRGVTSEMKKIEKLIRDPATDLSAKVPWGDGQTYLREALLAIDHTSYHVGQLILLRKQLGAWKP